MNNSGTPDGTLMTEKLTYFRKNRLGKKKLGSLSACMHSQNNGSAQQVRDISGDKKMPGSMHELTEPKVSNAHSQGSLAHKIDCPANIMSIQASPATRLLNTGTGTRKRHRLRKVTESIETTVPLPLCDTKTSTFSKDNCSSHCDNSNDLIKEVLIKEVKGKMKELSALEQVLNKTEKIVDDKGSDLNFQQGPEGCSDDVSKCKYMCVTLPDFGFPACRLIAAVMLFISSFYLFFHICSKKIITREEEGRDG